MYMYKVIYVDRVISILPPRCGGVVVDYLLRMRDFGVWSPIGADLGDLIEESHVKKTKTKYIFEVCMVYNIQSLSSVSYGNG